MKNSYGYSRMQQIFLQKKRAIKNVGLHLIFDINSFIQYLLPSQSKKLALTNVGYSMFPIRMRRNAYYAV